MHFFLYIHVAIFVTNAMKLLIVFSFNVILNLAARVVSIFSFFLY